MPTVPELISDLARAFPRQPVTNDTLRIYTRELDDIPADMLEQAVRELIRTSEFFPTVRAIREVAAERTLQLPSENDALAQIEARMRWGRTEEAERSDEPPELHPLIREALDHVGGWHAFRAAEEPGVIRGQFLRLYRELRARGIHEAKVGSIALPAGPRRHELTA